MTVGVPARAEADLGSDSLRAVRIVARLQERLGPRLPVPAVLRTGAVAAMAGIVVAALLAQRGPAALAELELKR